MRASSLAAYTPPPAPLSSEALSALHGQLVTLVGFGSLLSETSSRTTFPTLTNFRFGRIQGYRRVFRHPAAIFYERQIARPETKEVSSLSAEPADGDNDCGFVCSLFDAPDFKVQDFIDREEEFDFSLVDYTELDDDDDDEGDGEGKVASAASSSSSSSSSLLSSSPKDHGEEKGGDRRRKRKGKGLMCRTSTDERVEARWGEGYIKRKYGIHGVDTIWGWAPDSGILPCPVYLRHCVLAAQKAGGQAYESFLKDTYLADRKTTIAQHLERRPDIMLTVPPPSVANRYTG